MAGVAPLENSYLETSVTKMALKCAPWLMVLLIFGINPIVSICLCAIALIQNDTPTSKTKPLLDKRHTNKVSI